jgi:CheY-like chemotaxis protein
MASSDDAPALRVLLVEDHPDLAMVTEELLRGERLEVRTALSGREAVEIARAFRPQLLLCDLNLPDMTGLEVIRELRSVPSTECTYAVILTATRVGELGSRAEAEQQRVDAVVSKPITVDTIRTLIQKLAAR